MAATNQRVTKAQFHRINRFVKDQRAKGVYNADRIAKHFNVSPSTVRTIARMKTYPKFVEYKASRKARVGVAANRRVAMNGVELTTPTVPVQPAQLPLSAAPKRYVTVELTRDEYRELVSLRERVEALEAWRQNRLDAEKALISLNQADELQPRRRGLFGRRR